MLLGDAMIRFHSSLERMSAENPSFHYHYVTAREMYNLVRAAEAGWQGTDSEARDFALICDLTSTDARQKCVQTAGATS